jgi:Cd(II)/Pb(II)-responsive transcriptional regulator
MRIGELAKQTGTPIETIRFYERERLLPAPERTEGNYRNYSPAHAEQLGFVRHCRSLDMALDEIRLLLQFKDAPNESCAEVNDLLDDHIGHVASRIRELKALERELKTLRDQCQEVRGAQSCGILKKLSSAPKPVNGRPVRPHVHGTHR